MPSTKDMLRNAGRWFLHSGIQEPSGGVARYYRAGFGRNAAVSTEITGYTVSTLVYLHKRLGEDAYLDGAIRAARYLMYTAWDAGSKALPFEMDGPGYFFDTGIAARGFLALHRVTKEKDHLDFAIECGMFMAKSFVHDTGFHPIVSLPERTALPYEPRWSRSPGCYQLKAALAWWDLSEVTGNMAFRAYYDYAVELALKDAPAFLPGESNGELAMDRIHAFCYFLEGLQGAIDENGFEAATREGIVRAARLLRKIAPVFERSDVNAQILRARIFAAHLGIVPIDRKAAAEEAANAARFQVASEDPALDGGFCFGQRGGHMEPFQNPVSTAFCLQALDQWELFQRGEYRADRAGLI